MSANSTTTFSWKVAILLSFGVGLLAAGFSVMLQVRSETIQSVPDDNQDYLVAAPAARGVGSSFEVPDQPMRLLIPAIGVDAPIQSVGLASTGNGDMGIPTNFTDVAWYNQGPLPGMPGSSVIDGHLDGKNVPQAIFFNLGSLKPGDLVQVVDRRGKVLKFQVVNVGVYDYDTSTNDIFSADVSKARLNLITCAGDWIKSEKLYDKRMVVFTELLTTN